MQVFMNGRRCASVEKFTELVLNQRPSSILAEEEEEEDGRTIAYAPPRDLETAFPSFRSDLPQTTFFGTFTKQPSINNQRPLLAGRGVQLKMRNNGYPPPNGSQRPSTSVMPPKQEAVYRPESLASSAPTQKTYEKLAEVYSSSDDTVQFAGNLRTFLSERIPLGVWVGFAALEILIGLVLLFVGALNLPMCEIQPLIPVYLMAAGVVLIFHGVVRIFASIPTPPASRRQRNKQSRLNRDLCLYAIEGVVLLIMVIVVILGAVFVYGARYVHFHEGLFEQDYCSGFIYWTAWWSVTLHLVLIALLILTLIFFLIYGSVVSN